MNFILLSDPHATLMQPAARMDIIRHTFTQKFQYVLNYTKKANLPLFISGDLFDRPQEWKVLLLVMDMIKESGIKVYLVYGQHDMYMRISKKSITTINVLIRSGTVTLLGSKPINIDGVKVYGSSWGEAVPTPKMVGKKNMLVAHKPVYQSKLYPGQQGMDVESFAKRHSLYDLIHVGDIHRRFICKSANIVVNTGPLLRLEATKYNIRHKPSFAIYDHKNNIIKFMEIPHEPGRAVLDMSLRKEVRRKNKYLDKFTSSLKSTDFKSHQRDVKDDIKEFIKKNEIDGAVIEALNEIMEEANGT